MDRFGDDGDVRRRQHFDARNVRHIAEGARLVLPVVPGMVLFGMAFGGYFSGVIFDLTASYKMAFLNGVIWNAFNLAVVGWLYWRSRKPSPGPGLLQAA